VQKLPRLQSTTIGRFLRSAMPSSNGIGFAAMRG
jgi:hypothetical protein